MKSSKQFRNIARNHDGSIAYQVAGSSAVYRALPRNPANDKLTAAHRALLARRQQIKQQSENALKPAVAKPETPTEAPAPDRKPWWMRFLEFLGISIERRAPHQTKVIDPNLIKAVAAQEIAQERSPVGQEPEPSVESLQPQVSQSQSAPTPAAPRPQSPDATPEEPKADSAAPREVGSEPLFKSIEPTATGYKVTFPDGFEMEVEENSHEGQVLSAALEEADKIVTRADLAIADLEQSAAAPARRPSAHMQGVEGMLQEMPPAASGIRRFGVDLQDGRWVALNPSPRERNMLSELADKGALGKVQVAVSDLSVAIKAIELDSKMVPLDDLQRSPAPSPAAADAPEGEMPPETVEPESVNVEELPIVPSPTAPEASKDTPSGTEQPPSPTVEPKAAAADVVEPEKERAAPTEEVQPPAPTSDQPASPAPGAAVETPAAPQSPSQRTEMETDIVVAHLHNVDRGSSVETCLVTGKGEAFRITVGSDEAREKLRGAADVAPLSIGVRFDENNVPVPVCVFEQDVEGHDAAGAVPSFESVFGKVEKIEKHPDPELQSALSAYAASFNAPSETGQSAQQPQESSEPDPFHHYRTTSSEPEMDR